MRVKTSELIGAALNFAVSVVEGYDPKDLRPGVGGSLSIALRDERGKLTGMISTGHTYLSWLNPCGAMLAERHEIGYRRNVPCTKGREWEALPSLTTKGAGMYFTYGSTPLIAMMRCFVASKLGDEVDVPEELLA